MRRRKDPIPPGAEIYWGHRASFAVLGWMLTLPALFLAAIVWNDRRSGTGDWIAVALFFLFTAGLWLVIAGLMRSYMLIDGDRVEIRVFSGEVIRFTLGEITGYRFGPLLRRPVIRQYPTLLLYRNGERLPADFLQIPGSDRLRERLRERGLQPQLLTPEERAGRFPDRGEDFRDGIVETVYLLVGAECGVPALLAMLLWFLWYWVSCLRLLKRLKNTRYFFLPAGLLGGLTAAYAQSCFEWVLRQQLNLICIMFLFATLSYLNTRWRWLRDVELETGK